jgi:hypothetical protein
VRAGLVSRVESSKRMGSFMEFSWGRIMHDSGMGCQVGGLLGDQTVVSESRFLASIRSLHKQLRNIPSGFPTIPDALAPC